MTSLYVTDLCQWSCKQGIQLARITFYQRIRSIMFGSAETCRIMTDSQATDFVTFDFKGSRIWYFADGSTDHRMNFCLVHYVAK